MLILTGSLLVASGATCIGVPPANTNVVDGNVVPDGAVVAPLDSFPRSTDGTNDSDIEPVPVDSVKSGEPNDTFALANPVLFTSTLHASLTGTISTSDDIDVYRRGALQVGDRIVVDVGHGGDLDADVAIFDEQGRLAFENDDRNTNLNQLDPFINQVIRRTSNVYYLGVSAAPLGDSSQMTGTYDIEITIARGGDAAPVRAQTVVLNFGGGTAQIPDDPRGPYTVGAFNTADIWPAYAGLTAAVEQQIVDIMKEKYQGLQLTVLRTPGDILPGGPCAYSTVFFGGRNPNAYGTSQQVDALNADLCDVSIVFTEMFTPGRFGRLLSAQELGTAIGNVAAHELGHLLGLNHVDNITDIMDTTGGANTFLLDQEFKNSILDPSIFGIGTQDSLLLLIETLGRLSSGG